MNKEQRELAEAIQAAMDAAHKVAKLTVKAFPPGGRVYWTHGAHLRYATVQDGHPVSTSTREDLGVVLDTGRNDWKSLCGIYSAMFGHEFIYRRSDGQ